MKWGTLILALQVLLLRRCHLDVFSDKSGSRQHRQKPISPKRICTENDTCPKAENEPNKSENGNDCKSRLESFIIVDAIEGLGAFQTAMLFFVELCAVPNGLLSVHNGLEKSNSVYDLITVLWNRFIHTDAVLGDAAARNLKRRRKRSIVSYYNVVSISRPYLNFERSEVVEMFLIQRISLAVFESFFQVAKITVRP